MLKYAAITNLFTSKNKKPFLTKSVKLNLNKSALKDCTNIAYNNINKQYQKTFGMNFTDILVETQKGLQRKASQVQKKWEKGNQVRAFASNMEMLWKENTFDRYSTQRKEGSSIIINSELNIK